MFVGFLLLTAFTYDVAHHALVTIGENQHNGGIFCFIFWYVGSGDNLKV